MIFSGLYTKDVFKFGLLAGSFASLCAVLYPYNSTRTLPTLSASEIERSLLSISMEGAVPFPEAAIVNFMPRMNKEKHMSIKMSSPLVERPEKVIYDSDVEPTAYPRANWLDISYPLHHPYLSVMKTNTHNIAPTKEREGLGYRFSRIVPIFKPSMQKVKASMNCFVQEIAGEARGETDTGQVGVAAVVKNRVKAWGGTYCSNIYSKSHNGCQFYGACHGVKNYPQDVVDKAKTIAAAVISGSIHDVTGGALYFHTCSVGQNENGHRFLRKIKNHCYYAEDMAKKHVDSVSYKLIKDDTKAYGYRMEEYRI